MKIIIAGGGEVGYYLAKLLTYEYHNIIFIDINKEKLKHIETSLGVMTVKGDSSSLKVLKQAKIDKADLLIAVTSSQTVNITTCIIGKKLGAKCAIARISNMEYLLDKETLDLRDFGIDELISPESLVAREVKHLLQEPAVFDTFEFEGGKLVLMGVLLDENSPIIDKSLAESAELNPFKDFMIVAIYRDGKIIIPRGDFRFKPGDQVYFIALEEGKNSVLSFVGKQHLDIHNLMIVGGSRPGAHIARRLNKYYSIKLIEKNRQKSNELAKALSNVLVINGDCTNVELLQEERIDEMDAFVAVTNSTETNIFACLMAKERGVKKTIALVENIGFVNISKTLGIDTMINKKLTTADFIFRYIRGRNVISFTSIPGDAEILEFQVGEDARITRKKIKELNFPKNAIISGVVRKQEGFITLGDFQLQADDRVVVLALPDSIREVESFFKK